MVRREDDLHLPLGVPQLRLDGHAALPRQVRALVSQEGAQHVLDGVGVAAEEAHDDPDVRLHVNVVRILVANVEQTRPVPDGLDERPEGVLHQRVREEAPAAGSGAGARGMTVGGEVDVRALETVGERPALLAKTGRLLPADGEVGGEYDD